MRANFVREAEGEKVERALDVIKLGPVRSISAARRNIRHRQTAAKGQHRDEGTAQRCTTVACSSRDASEAADNFKIAATEQLVCGFVGGRALFGATLEAWLRREIDDAAALDQLTTNFANVAAMWDSVTRGYP
jgi:myo-inositol catabolism protein IolC